MYVTEEGFLFSGTKEQYEAEQKAKQEQWNLCLKQLENDKKERPWIYKDNLIFLITDKGGIYYVYRESLYVYRG